MLFLSSFIICIFTLGALWLYLSRKRSATHITLQLEQVSQLLALGQYRSALKTLNHMKVPTPYQEHVIVMRMDCLKNLGQYHELVEEIKPYLQRFSHNIALRLAYAKALVEMGLVDEAALIYQDFEITDLSQPDLYSYCKVLVQTDQHEKALHYLSAYLPQLHSEDPGYKDWLLLTGDCYFFQGKYEQATNAYKMVIKMPCEHTTHLARLAHCLFCLKDYALSKQYYLQLAKQMPHNNYAILGLGACLEALGQYRQAFELYHHEAKTRSDDPKILRQAGTCAFYLKKYKLAQEYLQDAFRKGEHSPEHLHLLGQTFERQRLIKQAEIVYEQQMRLYPQHPSAYLSLAYLFAVGLSERIDVEHGLQYAKMALRLNPTLNSWEVLSAAEARAGNFYKAHDILEKLSYKDHQAQAQHRRKEAMRELRKKRPLSEIHIGRPLVA